jgi:anthranilate phosphoribosyltransferase
MLQYETTDPTDLHGGKTVTEAADIFLSVLEGNGTNAQNNVVIANAQLAIKCYYPSKSLEECRVMAEDSLYGGKALRSLKMLIEMQS